MIVNQSINRGVVGAVKKMKEIKESDESMCEEPTEGDSEEIADNKQDNALCKTSCKIWDEIEDVICEVIEDEESKQGERKGVREGVDEEGAVVEDVDQIAMVSGEKMAKVEEEVINKTEDKIEVRVGIKFST